MKFQKGLSLIELMVAMALSLVMMVGVTQIFIGNKKSFELTYDLGLMQENGRIAGAIIADSIRMADHWAGIENSAVTYGTTTLSSAPIGCGSAWVFDPDRPVRGYDGAASIGAVPNFPASCIPAADYEANTDILVVRYADGKSLSNDAAIALAANKDTYYVRALVGQSAYVFKGSDNAVALAETPFEDSVYNMAYGTDMYFVRACSIQIAGVCQDDTPTLVRLTLRNDTYEQEVLIEGIEQLQFDYGVDIDNDLNVDEYVPAGVVGNSDDAWESVISVRLNIIARSTVPDFSIDETGRTYIMIGDMDTVATAYVVAAGDGNFRRKLYQREVYIRNRGLL